MKIQSVLLFDHVDLFRSGDILLGQVIVLPSVSHHLVVGALIALVHWVLLVWILAISTPACCVFVSHNSWSDCAILLLIN